MARIAGADPRKGGFFPRLFTRFTYRAVRKKLGKVVMPVQVVAHHPKVLWGYVQMELAFQGSRQVNSSLKSLAQLRVATLVGCPF